MKNFLVIGGTSGIGKSIALKLAEAGHNIIVASRGNQSISPNDHIRQVIYDATMENPGMDFLPETLDGLVYTPGTINLKPFQSLRPEDFINDMNINFFGAVKTIRLALPALKKSKTSSILLFSTVAVQQGMAFHSSIAAAKGAVEGLTRSLAAELAPAIRVNAIAPSLTRTPLADRLLGSQPREEASAQRHPLKRIGEPGDIASMAVFLLEESAGWITGQVFGVDGGMSTLR